jgi:hypothetical protein
MNTSGNVVAVLAVVLACLAASAAPTSAAPGGAGVVAVFEGNEIDLTLGWGNATACLDRGASEVVECFSTEEELLERVAEIDKGPAATSSWCSGYLASYDGTNYTGSVLTSATATSGST